MRASPSLLKPHVDSLLPPSCVESHIYIYICILGGAAVVPEKTTKDGFSHVQDEDEEEGGIVMQKPPSCCGGKMDWFMGFFNLAPEVQRFDNTSIYLLYMYMYIQGARS